MRRPQPFLEVEALLIGLNQRIDLVGAEDVPHAVVDGAPGTIRVGLGVVPQFEGDLRVAVRRVESSRAPRVLHVAGPPE
jgi:hypothetical protein